MLQARHCGEGLVNSFVELALLSNFTLPSTCKYIHKFVYRKKIKLMFKNFQFQKQQIGNEKRQPKFNFEKSWKTFSLKNFFFGYWCIHLTFSREIQFFFFYFYIQNCLLYVYGLYIRREYLTIHYFCYAVFAIWKAFYEMKFFFLRHGRDVQRRNKMKILKSERNLFH